MPDLQPSGHPHRQYGRSERMEPRQAQQVEDGRPQRRHRAVAAVTMGQCMELVITRPVLPGRADVLGDFNRFAEAFGYGPQRPSDVAAEAELVIHRQSCDPAMSLELTADLLMPALLVH